MIVRDCQNSLWEGLKTIQIKNHATKSKINPSICGILTNWICVAQHFAVFKMSNFAQPWRLKGFSVLLWWNSEVWEKQGWTNGWTNEWMELRTLFTYTLTIYGCWQRDDIEVQINSWPLSVIHQIWLSFNREENIFMRNDVGKLKTSWN